MASAALEEGVINESTTFYCPGKFRLDPNGRAWHCWKRGGHGSVSVVDALAFSCDVFFYNVGLQLGVDRMHDYATRVGLGGKTGIDLAGEAAGLIPSREWREQKLMEVYPNEPWNRRWYPGDTLNFSIGQGDTATTPLQNAMLMAAVINGGYRVRPYLNRALDPELSERIFSDRTIDIIRRGLLKCVEKGPPAPTGTGRAARVEGFQVLGKTGSAQMVGLEHHEQYETEEDIPKELRDHAWFVAGVLDRDPAIAICILIEHGHHGSSMAAPLAKTVIEYFYQHYEATRVDAQAETD
jgi:penicillin-binding protein 2